MDARRLVRTVYTHAAGSRALRRPLGAIRSHPRLRSFARRNVGLLLGRGATWSNVDGALRLLAEDRQQTIVFGPWTGDPLEELLYWAPFVRWATSHFSLDPERTVVVSRGSAGDWYAGCGAYVDAERTSPPSGAAWFPPDPVLALIGDYRSGAAAPRPVLKRAQHVRLSRSRPAGSSRDAAYVVTAFAPSAAFPASDENVELAGHLTQALSGRGTVVSLAETADASTQHELVAGATGLVASWSSAAVLGVLCGVPTLALRSPGGDVYEPDLDLAARIAGRLGTSLTVLATSHVRPLVEALSGPISSR
jgi:hypothetical protein